MQKLVFRNANGIELDLTSGDYGITEWEGFSAVDLNVQSQQVPFQDGSVYLDGLLGERELAVTVAMQDNSNLEKRYQLRRQMISVLNPKLGEGVLIYTNDYISKQIHCVAQMPVFENHNSNDSGTPKASCSFIACNPYWEDLEDTVVEIANTTTLSNIVNNGDIPTGMKIDVINNSYDTKRIVIDKEGKKIELNSFYAFPREINIDTRTGKKYVTGKGLFSNEGQPYTLSDTNYTSLARIIFDGEYYFSYSKYDNESEESYNAFFISKDMITWTKQGNDLEYLGIDELNVPKMIYNDFDNSIYLLLFPNNGVTRLLKTSDRGATWETTELTGNYRGLCLNRKTQEIVYTEWDCVYNPTTQEVVELYYDENTGNAGIKINRSSGAIIKTYENFGVEVEYIELDSKNNYIVYHGTGQNVFPLLYIDVDGNLINRGVADGFTGFLEREDGYYFIVDVPYASSGTGVEYTPSMENIPSDMSQAIQFFTQRIVFSKINGKGIAVDYTNQQIFFVKETQNYISNLTSDSNMNLELDVGTNKILTVTDTLTYITISYRQKYLGV